jgi:hypothetical protein
MSSSCIYNYRNFFIENNSLQKNKKYHTVGTDQKSNRKTRNTTLSEQIKNLTEKQEISLSHSKFFPIKAGPIKTILGKKFPSVFQQLLQL